MKFSRLALAASAALLSLPASVQAEEAAVDLTIGTTVYGPKGGEVGTIEQVNNGNVLVDTGNNKAALPAASFATGPKGPMIGFSKAQLDAAVEAAQQKADAALASALVAGASLRSIDGVPLGTIEAIEEDKVTVALESGPIQLTKDQFATDANGLIVRFTAEQLRAALAQAAS